MKMPYWLKRILLIHDQSEKMRARLIAEVERDLGPEYAAFMSRPAETEEADDG